MSAMLEKDTAR